MLGDICHILLLHLSHELSTHKCIVQWLRWKPVLLAYCQFHCSVMEPPAVIITFLHSCVSSVHTQGPQGELCTVGKTKLNADILKRKEGAGVRGCSIFSKWCSLREHACGCLDFIEGWLSPAETDYLQPASCFCCEWECSMERAGWHGAAHATHSFLLVWTLKVL